MEFPCHAKRESEVMEANARGASSTWTIPMPFAHYCAGTPSATTAVTESTFSFRARRYQRYPQYKCLPRRQNRYTASDYDCKLFEMQPGPIAFSKVRATQSLVFAVRCTMELRAVSRDIRRQATAAVYCRNHRRELYTKHAFHIPTQIPVISS